MHPVQFKFIAYLVAFILVNVCPPASLRGETELDWDSENTWVFAVGILEWEHSDIYPSFPSAMKDRRDAQLVEYFKDAGVPEKQVNYLQDSAATKQRIEREFRELLDETDEGD